MSLNNPPLSAPATVRWASRFAKVSASLFCVLVGFLNPAASADDPLDDLRQRIERLERENQALKDRLNSDTLPASFSPDVPPPPTITELVDPNDPLGGAEETEEEKQFNSMVERYLRRRGISSNSSAADAQSGRISNLETNIAGILDRLNKKTFPSVQVYGAFQADTGYFFQDTNSTIANGDIANGADIRRARLGAKGAINEVVNYTFQMDFGFFGRPTFTDVFVEQTNIPYLGKVRVGQWKQPFSLEVVSSYRYTTFMERSVLFQSFTPFRHLGAGFYDNSEDLTTTWAASVFTTGQDQFGNTLFEGGTAAPFSHINMGGVGTAERLTWLPYWDECTEGRDYLHLGAAHFFSAPPGQTVVFRSIPELFIGQAANVVNGGSSFQPTPGGANGTPFFVNTGNLTVNYYNILGTEILYVRGPFSFQSEAMVNFVDRATPGGGVTATSAVLPGAYGTVGYFLTGEHRPYDRKGGVIDRIMPFNNFSFKDGCRTGIGAWELAGRVSYLDLNDRAIQGGTLTDYTVGINWYANPYVKFVFNYIHADSFYGGLGGAPPAPNAPQRRTQTDMIAFRCQMDW